MTIPAPDYTADQIADGIVRAFRSRDIHAVPSLIRLLALQDPDRAQVILDAIQFGISLRDEEVPWASD